MDGTNAAVKTAPCAVAESTSEAKQADLLIAALKYWQMGLPPIPVHDKKALVKWSMWQKNRPEWVKVAGWFSRQWSIEIEDQPNIKELVWPNGVALVTGARSGLVCIDIDPGGEDTISELKLHLPATVSERTPRGGWHLYYKHPGPNWEVRGFTSKCIGLPGVDIRGDGNYAVCAPSAGYEWAPGLSPADIEPAELPKWMWELKDSAGEPVMRRRSGAARRSVPADRDEDRSEPRDVLQEEYTLLVTSPSVSASQASSRSGPSGLSAARPGAHTMQVASSSPLGDLAALATVPAVAFAVLELCGRKVDRLGKAFLCPLPGHAEKSPSAALWQRPGQPIMMIDFHMRPQLPDSPEDAAADPMIDQAAATAPQKHWMLADVYAACKTGKARKLTKGKRAIWWLRCLHELGIINPPEQVAPKLPNDAPEEAHQVFSGFQLALSLRTFYDSSQISAPFGYNFGADWCGIGRRKVEAGMKWLIKSGYLRVVGSFEEGTKKYSLYGIGRPRR